MFSRLKGKCVGCDSLELKSLCLLVSSCRLSPLEKTSSSGHSESTVFKQPPPLEPPRSSPPPNLRDPPWPYGGPSPSRPSPGSTEKSPAQRAECGSANAAAPHARSNRPYKTSSKRSVSSCTWKNELVLMFGWSASQNVIHVWYLFLGKLELFCTPPYFNHIWCTLFCPFWSVTVIMVKLKWTNIIKCLHFIQKKSVTWTSTVACWIQRGRKFVRGC